MAIAVQTIVDGPRNAILKLVNDTGAAETAALKVDVSALSPATSSVRIDRASVSVTGGVGDSASLLWDATADKEIISFPAGDSQYYDFRMFGGLVNDAGAGVTGDIRLTSSTGVTYTITLWLVKR